MEITCADCGCLVDRGVIVRPCAKHPDCCCRDLDVRPDGVAMSCSCCGRDKQTVPLRSRDDVQLCRECLEWLLGQFGVNSSPILPVVDLADAVAFYERAGFGVRPYRDKDGTGDGFAFVDIDGQSVFDLDAAPDMDPATNRAACYLITEDTEAWHARLSEAGLAVTSLTDQPWGMREFTLRDPSGNHVRMGRGIPNDASDARAPSEERGA